MWTAHRIKVEQKDRNFYVTVEYRSEGEVTITEVIPTDDPSPESLAAYVTKRLSLLDRKSEVAALPAVEITRAVTTAPTAAELAAKTYLADVATWEQYQYAAKFYAAALEDKVYTDCLARLAANYRPQVIKQLPKRGLF